MKDEGEIKAISAVNRPRSTHCVRLPGFVIEEEIGLGDLIKRVTHALSIKPCLGCEMRAATLNRWMKFSR